LSKDSCDLKDKKTTASKTKSKTNKRNDSQATRNLICAHENQENFFNRSMQPVYV